MITRNDIFKWFKQDWQGQELSLIISIFRSYSDESLASTYNLKVLRKGYFIN